MSGLTRCCISRVPHMRSTQRGFPLEPSGVPPAGPRNRRARPARWCGTDVSLRTAPLSRTRRSTRRGRFAAPEVVEHRGDAVGPLLQGRQRARRDGIGGSRARLVEEDISTERRHRLEPTLNGRQLRKDFAAAEPVRDPHHVARTFTRCAIGDVQVPIQCIARLREHCRSLSPRERVDRRLCCSRGFPLSVLSAVDATWCIGATGANGVVATHRYGDATAKRCHSPGTPLSLVSAAVFRTRARIRSRGRAACDGHEYVVRPSASALTRAPICTAIPPMSSPRTSHSPVCNPARTAIPRPAPRRELPRAADRRVVGRRTSPRKPSPDVFTSRPRNRVSCDRTIASCASSKACQSRSPISAARRVESHNVGEAAPWRAKVFFANSVSPRAQVLTGGEMSFAETLRYGEATANRCHSPGTPFSS